MFAGRIKERRFLEECYEKEGSRLVVVYGRRGIGKTDLMRLMLHKYGGFYYETRDCSEREQLLLLRQELKERAEKETAADGLDALLELAAAGRAKALLVLDEFHFMAKGCQDFPGALLQLLKASGKPVMLVLCSSSVSWVEHDMVKSLGPAAPLISDLLKLKELSFLELSAGFKDSSVEECVSIYGILGGVPKYMNYWNPERSRKENIKRLFLNREGRLYREGPELLKTELRELSLYNTILAALSSDRENMRLNNLYERTGFSRAKISVYLKNLIQLDVAEKVFPYEAPGRENTQKGLYRVRDRLLRFWYQFIFPNLSELENGHGEAVYEKKVAPALDSCLEDAFSEVCTEYMGLLNLHGKLPFPVGAHGTWFGKRGTVDYAAEGENGGLLAAKCKWSQTAMSEEDFEELLSLLTQARMEPDYYYLFSRSGFTAGLEAKARNFESIRLMTPEQM